MRKGSADLSSLTPREEEVLGYIRRDLSNEQIAQQMGISIAGVKYHVSEILGKLGVENRHDAARWTSEQRPWWQSAGVLLSIPRPRLGWLSPAVGAALAVMVAIAVGLLVWALLATDGEQEEAAGPGPAGPLNAELVLDRPSPSFGAMDFVSDDEGWMLVAGGLLRTTDGGESWTEAARVTGADIDFADEDHGWIVGRSGSIYATTDGESWIEQDSGTDVNLSSVYAASDQEAWAVGSGIGISDQVSWPKPAILLHTGDGGASWQEIETPAYTWFGAITFIGSEGWLAGHQCKNPDQVDPEQPVCAPTGALLHTVDGGATWELLDANLPEWVRSFVMLDQEHGWIIGSCFTGKVECERGPFRTMDGGLSWELVTFDDFDFFSRFVFRDEHEGWRLTTLACEARPCPTELLRTSDGGETWTSMGEIDTGNGQYVSSLRAIKYSLFAFAPGTALRSTDGGVTFKRVTHPAVSLREVTFADERTGYSVSDDILLRTDDSGRSWQVVGPAPSRNINLYLLNPNRAFAIRQGADSLDFSESIDGGASWHVLGSVSLGQTSSALDELDIIYFDGEDGWVKSYGPIYRTTDGGKNWETISVESLGGDARSVDFVDAKHGWAIVEVDTYAYRLMVTRDGGEVWHELQQKYGYVPGAIDFADAQNGWNAVGGGGLRVTVDGGATWREIDLQGGELEDFVLVDRFNGWLSVRHCTAGVCRGELWQTNDGGGTWDIQVLGEGMSGALAFVDAQTGWLRPLSIGFSGPDPTIDGRTLLYKID